MYAGVVNQVTPMRPLANSIQARLAATIGALAILIAGFTGDDSDLQKHR